MPRTRLTGLLAAGLLLIAAAPAAAAPATVPVRVEGKADTLVPRTSVTTTTTAVNGVPIRLTDERWAHIVNARDYMAGY